MKIRFLKAFNGDSILITLPSEDGFKNILIDGGISNTYQAKKRKIEYGELKFLVDDIRNARESIDLLILTHIDDDHIDGIIEWFNNDPDAYKLIKEVWFNAGALIAEWLQEPENKELNHYIADSTMVDTSVDQGIEFSRYIQEKKIWNRKIVLKGNKEVRFGAEFVFLSPNKAKLETLLKEWKKKDPSLNTTAKSNDYHLTLEELLRDDLFEEDKAYPNGSSIAFILIVSEKNFLFLGDSHPSVIVDALTDLGYSEENPIKAELVKLSHHGSKGNTSVELLKLIKSDKFIISTNGRTHQHPHKQLLARLINLKENISMFFNYPERLDEIFLPADKDFAVYKAIPIENEFEF